MKQYNYNNPLHIQEALIAASKRKVDAQNVEVEQIVIKDNEQSTQQLPFTRLLFFEFKKYIETSTYEIPGLEIIFIPSDECQYTIKNNVLHINDYNDKEVNVDLVAESSTTVVYAKAGYLLNNITYLLNKFVEHNFIVLNDPRKITISSDKYLTAKMLSEYNISQPNYVLFEYGDCIGDDSITSSFEKKLKPIYGNLKDENKYICKILDGHGGSGVFMCNRKNILSILQCMFSIDRYRQILVQQKLTIKDGDIRVYVLSYNGKQEIVASITRKKADDDFRTNISLGSTFENFELTKKQEEFAKNVAAQSGLIFCGVDMCIDEETNKLYVIELNGAPGAPVAIGLQPEENHRQHSEYYIEFTNKLIDIFK